MALFQKKKPAFPPPLWSYKADGLIWRLQFAPNRRFIGELRNPEKKTAAYFCLDQETGRVLWSGLRLEEAWWVGLEGVHDGIVFLHGYRKPDMPQHKGIYAFDLETGAPLWRHSDAAFSFVKDGTLYASTMTFAGRTYLALDARSGAPLSDKPVDEEHILRMRGEANEENAFAECLYPEPLDEAGAEFPRYQSVLSTAADNAPVAFAEGLAVAGTLLFAWYEEHSSDGKTLYDQVVAFADQESGRLLFKDTINTGIEERAVDSFFVKDGIVLYIKNFHILTAHRLPFST